MKSRRGFTLIELLIVIAVVGTIAAVALVILNPQEQFARARDASRKAIINQLGKAIENYAITNNGYPLPGPSATPTWLQTLVSAGVLQSTPPLIANSTNTSCWGDASANQTGQNNYCYVRSTSTYVWTVLESENEQNKCSTSATTATTFFVYDTSQGRACIKCAGAYNGACNATQ